MIKYTIKKFKFGKFSFIFNSNKLDIIANSELEIKYEFKQGSGLKKEICTNMSAIFTAHLDKENTELLNDLLINNHDFKQKNFNLMVICPQLVIDGEEQKFIRQIIILNNIDFMEITKDLKHDLSDDNIVNNLITINANNIDSTNLYNNPQNK